MRAALSLFSVLVACGSEPSQVGPAFTRDPADVVALNGHFVTTNKGDDTLSVVAPEGPAPAARLPVGLSPVELEGPHHLSVDPQGRFLYVNLSMAVKGSGSGPHGAHGAGNLPGYVLKIEAATGRAVQWVQVDPNPGDNVISADGTTLFVTHYDVLRWVNQATAADPHAQESRLVMVDTETMRVRARVALCPAAHGVRLSLDETTAYATCGSDELAIVDLLDPSLPVRRVPLPDAATGTACQSCPYALGVAPDGRVWVSSLGPDNGRTGLGRVDVFDPSLESGGAFDLSASIRLAGSPLFVTFAMCAEGLTLSLPEQGAGGNFVRWYSPGGAGTPSKELAALSLQPDDCVRPHMLWMGPQPARGYLVCEGDHVGPGTFVWLDLESRSVLGSTSLGVFPDALAFVGGR